MASTQDIVIVGAGLAGASAAGSLRVEEFTGRIILIGDEPHLPYERPPLSKGYLLGNDELETAFVHPADWYAEHAVELRTDVEVVALDRAAHEVVLAGGERVPYGKVLLATGSEPLRLDVPGGDLAGVLTLRRIEDSQRLKDAYTRASRVVIIGGGWIGLETAAAARAAGLEVTLLERGELPLIRVLGLQVATVFADLHREHGVDLRTSTVVAEILGVDGVVTGVRLGDGSTIDTELVVVGVGIRPCTELATASGLEVDNGILTDEHLRTFDPDVFAAGDVANATHPMLRRRLRVEHWANAIRQGELAGRTMLGRDDVDDRSPYFFSDQYDLGMEYTGYVEPGDADRVVFRGDVAAREFVAFWLAGDRVLAGMNVNVWDVADTIDVLIRSGRSVDVGRLTDPAVGLDEV
ncbi:MAG: FAD-dependent oxidoreductase [Cellulomonas sp.]|uniref:NAD(P)/FAD-dependent oxidoreductase n=1 Tax=Cellulomonas sp. TaxID=40001 RepID=UPI0017FC5FE0|nr:FAD-dependent oxidoreductase [Cellulomonas sp.]NMM15602.1 FAD-dependent oxidoreductase [Cellulomonas sp.]NMM30867.1 FAD-dependent oxidoreductase [Cellulomonas sp.]